MSSGTVKVEKTSACILTSDVQLKSVKVTVAWTLDGFAALLAKQARLISPTFDVRCGQHMATRWQIEVDATGQQQQQKDDVGLALRAVDRNDAVEYCAHFQFRLGEGTITNQVVKDCYHELPPQAFPPTGHRGWPAFIKRDALLTTVVKNDVLVVKATVIVYHSHLKDGQGQTATIATLFKEHLGDFTIRCRDGGNGSNNNVPYREIKVFKTLLSKASPVFARMIAADMKERKTGAVTIDDLAFDTIFVMVKAIYMGAIVDGADYSVNEIAALLCAANKYQIDGLKHQCQELLIAQLALHNVCELLSISDLHQAFALKTAATNLIFADVEAARAAPDWKDLEKNNGPLLSYLLSEAMKAKKN